jgi:hypothetical protein
MEMANRDIGIIAFKDLGPEEGGEGRACVVPKTPQRKETLGNDQVKLKPENQAVQIGVCKVV